MTGITEAVAEEAALEWLRESGWQAAYGPDIAPDSAGAERDSYEQVVLERRLRAALASLNPNLPAGALESAFRKLTRPEGSTLAARNRAFHRMLVWGVEVEYRTAEGAIRGAQARVVDFERPSANDWFAVNQFTVTENKHTHRPDVVLFVNGLPLGVIELKNPANEDATIWDAWRQLQTYKEHIPSLFALNELLIVSDGNSARAGTLTAGREWFKPWRTIGGLELADAALPELEVMLEGVCAPVWLLALIRTCIVFEDDGGALVKKMAGYHQFHAVRVAVDETLRATELQVVERSVADVTVGYESGRRPGGERGDRRIGVVWHTQGSGKSLTMAFYAGAIIREPAMENPTIVVLTDRNDLDDQLFGTFARCQDLLRQPPDQAESRADLRGKLAVESGGVVFTTIQKFFPDEKRERQFCEQLRYNLLFKWFLDLNVDEEPFAPTTFTKNRERLLEADVARAFLAEVVAEAGRRELLSDDHFSVDGTLLEAWASLKSYRPRDEQEPPSGSGGRNAEVDFRGQRRSRETHVSTTDAEARLYRKGSQQEAKLSYLGHALSENRHGLVVDVELSEADGYGERKAALRMLDRSVRGRATLGADRGYDTRDFVAAVRARGVTPHVARNDRGRRSAIDGRTTRHPGYGRSLRRRKLVEEVFGWMKTVGGGRKLRYTGRRRNRAWLEVTAAAYNLVRMSRLEPVPL